MIASPFVGREREEAYVRGELEAGRSVVLTGPFGMGRTSLVRHAAAGMAAEWAFVIVDFDRPPGEVWRGIFAALFPRAANPERGDTRPMRWIRFRVLNRPAESRRRHVVVLDNVARLTAPRLDLLGRLRGRYPVVAIVEDFLPDTARGGLCEALRARTPLRLAHLGPAATLAYFEECSRRHGFGWGAGEVRGLARATHGFPLGMREAVEAERRRREEPQTDSTASRASAGPVRGARITPWPPASPRRAP